VAILDNSLFYTVRRSQYDRLSQQQLRFLFFLVSCSNSRLNGSGLSINDDWWKWSEQNLLCSLCRPTVTNYYSFLSFFHLWTPSWISGLFISFSLSLFRFVYSFWLLVLDSFQTLCSRMVVWAIWWWPKGIISELFCATGKLTAAVHKVRREFSAEGRVWSG